MNPLPAAWRDGDLAATLVPQGDAFGRLAELLGCAAGTVVMWRDADGKPLLSQPAGAAYSVAHRAGMSLVAAGWNRAIGADLELVRDDLPLGDIADTCFSAAEAGWLRGLVDDRHALAFTIIWAIKEAVLKATGRGIIRGMANPAIPGAALLPLLGGDAYLSLRLADLDVYVRQGTIGPAHAVACVAAASPASEPSATAESRPLPDR